VPNGAILVVDQTWQDIRPTPTVEEVVIQLLDDVSQHNDNVCHGRASCIKQTDKKRNSLVSNSRASAENFPGGVTEKNIKN